MAVKLPAPSWRATSPSAPTASSASPSSVIRRAAPSSGCTAPRGRAGRYPPEARVYAEQHHIRLIGVDRPGIGSSTPHQYATSGFRRRSAHHRRRAGHRQIRRHRAVRRWALHAGRRGGHARPGGGRRRARWRGPHPRAGRHRRWGDDLGSTVAPMLEVAGAAGPAGRGHADQADPAGRVPRAGVYAGISPEGDRRLLARPEFKAMFLDDLLNGSRKQLAAPFADVVVFARDWGFRLDEVKVPVHWWHGDKDHIVPFAHGEHVVSRLPDAEMYHCPARAIWPAWPRRGDPGLPDGTLGRGRREVIEAVRRSVRARRRSTLNTRDRRRRGSHESAQHVPWRHLDGGDRRRVPAAAA